jgi:23S rRNA (guanosine2251-2'-O)-methyltransferase
MERLSRLNPILEVVRVSPGRVSKVYIQKDVRKEKVDEISRLARVNRIPVVFVPQKTLDKMDRNHQGIIAIVTPREYSTLDAILVSTDRPFLVLLDEVEDPQNLGAIIRTAEGAGVDGILLPERRSAGLTRAVSQVSAGAVEHMKIARVKNLARAMGTLRERGVWLVGAEGGSGQTWHEFDYTLPVGLVFGSEGKGLRPLVRKKCDAVLSLPLLGRMTSLNVASAAAVFIYEVVRQRMSPRNE